MSLQSNNGPVAEAHAASLQYKGKYRGLPEPHTVLLPVTNLGNSLKDPSWLEKNRTVPRTDSTLIAL